ncbi:hypothetical protein LTR37_014561 [Vermiconidia calcicola]|uniref:Uncharacterized protein n=1 Tax=Vermiconidia calcicola TaxID=1690605 RepID=A0ACC3MUN5_9PEZI|nr:hypothetical protein LTR37_014561 [Vermiconidia calcicola]
MEAAKASVKKFVGKSGQHDTTVHEKVAPAVVDEQVARTEHENITSAIDREVHQDHYHTTVQPVNDREVLPEEHHHNAAPVEHRSFEHDNPQDVERRLAEERAQFQNRKSHFEGEHTRSTDPAVMGEHKHHHVYENIQPVVNKQTIEPHVVHTTVPIHEVHHNATQHHAASALPAVSMDEFKKQGGSLTGREERKDHFKDEPRLVGDKGIAGRTRSGSSSSSSSDEEKRRTRTTGTGTSGYGTTGSSAPGYGTTSPGNTGYDTNSSNTKPSFMDKLNPSKDANGDGSAGFMK